MKLLKTVFIIISFLFVIFISNLINLINPFGILNSPDEITNYLTMKEYASTGKMYFEGKYLEHDINNLLHQRGFLTWNNKLVTFNFLGFPFFYGPIYNFFLDDIKIILTIIYIVLLLAVIYKLYNLFYKENKNLSVVLITSFIFLIPVLYCLNFFYFNIIPNIIFFLFYLYYLLKFNKTWDKKNLYLSAIFASISIFFRYESIIFVSLIFLANIFLNYKDYKNISHKIALFILLFIIFFVFLGLPLLILNYQTYGNPFSYGYGIFFKVFFAEPKTAPIFQSLKNIFFPSRVFDTAVFLNNLKKVLTIFSPVFFVIVLLGFIRSNVKNIIPYFFIGMYFLIYAGMNPNIYLSSSEEISLTAAVLRYWLLLFPLFLLPFIHYIIQRELTAKIKILVMTFLIINSVLFITINDPLASIGKRKDYFSAIEKKREILKQIVLPSDYLITSTNGKIYYDIINIISWQGGASQIESDRFFNAKNIADIAKFLISKNHSVYYLADKFNSKYIPLLEKENLSFVPLKEFPRLYKINLIDEVKN